MATMTQRLIEGILAAAAVREDKTALVLYDANFEGMELTFGELVRMVVQVAEVMIAEVGSFSSQRVVVWTSCRLIDVVGSCAVNLLGGAYVPVSGKESHERIRDVCCESNAVCCIFGYIQSHCSYLCVDNNRNCPLLDIGAIIRNGKGKVTNVPIQRVLDTANRLLKLPKEDESMLAYILYSSGTTGRPKGIAVNDEGPLNTFIGIDKIIDGGVRESDVVLGLSQASFDLSVWDVFGVLSRGGTAVCIGEPFIKQPWRWGNIMHHQKVSIWNSVPALFGQFIESASRTMYLRPGEVGRREVTAWVRSIRAVMLSGDWIPMNLPAAARSLPGWNDATAILSLGGATEASIWSIFFKIPRTVPSTWTSIPYGTALHEQRMWVLDDDKATNGIFEEAEAGCQGMIFISGKGLAQEYWGNSELTEGSFVKLGGDRMYRTGDLGRYVTAEEQTQFGFVDKTIWIIGRCDLQVKIAGYRIDIPVVEKNILDIATTTIAECAVVPNRDNSTTIAAVCARPGHLNFSKSEFATWSASLLGELKRKLPWYAVPSHVVRLNEFPLGDTGKVNRSVLGQKVAEMLSYARLAPDGLTRNQVQAGASVLMEAAVGVTSESSRDEWYNFITRVWHTILPKYDETDMSGFFQTGGSSIDAIRLCAVISEVLGKSLSPSSLLTFPTLVSFRDYVVSFVGLAADHASHDHSAGNTVVVLQNEHEDENHKVNCRTWIIVAPYGGEVMCYRQLAASCSFKGLVLGIRPPFSTEYTYNDLIRAWMNDLDKYLSCTSKLIVSGYSAGCKAAYELAYSIYLRSGVDYRLKQSDINVFVIDGKFAGLSKFPPKKIVESLPSGVLESWCNMILAQYRVLRPPELDSCLKTSDSEDRLRLVVRALKDHGLLSEDLPLDVISRWITRAAYYFFTLENEFFDPVYRAKKVADMKMHGFDPAITLVVSEETFQHATDHIDHFKQTSCWKEATSNLSIRVAERVKHFSMMYSPEVEITAKHVKNIVDTFM